MTVPGSSVGVDQLPTVSVYLEPKYAGWVVRVGADVLAAGRWASAEAAAVQEVHNQAKIREAGKSLTGVPSKSLGQPKRAWPLPIVSAAGLLADLTAAMAEHAPAATAWWDTHDVDLAEGEFPWLMAISDVFVTPSTGHDPGTVGRLHGLGSQGFLLGSLTGRYPSVVVACPDAGDRHQKKKAGTGNRFDYWPKSLCGVVPKAKAPLGRHAFTVGGDAAAAYMAVYGLTPPARVLTAPMVVPGWVNPDAVDPDVYVPAAAVSVTPPKVKVKDVETPVLLTPVKDVETAVVALPAVNDAAGADQAATLRYIKALRVPVVAALAGTTPTLVDVIRACAVAVANTPAPPGAATPRPDDLAHLYVTRGGVAPELNPGGPEGPAAVRAAIDALTGP